MPALTHFLTLLRGRIGYGAAVGASTLAAAASLAGPLAGHAQARPLAEPLAPSGAQDALVQPAPDHTARLNGYEVGFYAGNVEPSVAAAHDWLKSQVTSRGMDPDGLKSLVKELEDAQREGAPAVQLEALQARVQQSVEGSFDAAIHNLNHDIDKYGDTGDPYWISDMKTVRRYVETLKAAYVRGDTAAYEAQSAKLEKFVKDSKVTLGDALVFIILGGAGLLAGGYVGARILEEL